MPLSVLVLLSPLVPGSFQAGLPAAPPPAVIHERTLGDLRWVIPGTVKDLARDSAGRILYCTAEREVGRLAPGAGRTVLAGAASFPNELRALAESGGDVAVVDVFGHVRVLVNGAPPAVQAYSDLYMILDASDLIVDARGSFLIASATPTSGQRAMNWIRSDGTEWGYYLVKHQPVALAHDPLTGGILMSESSAGGNLRLVQAGSPIRATTALDTTTHPGLSAAQSDGDLAVLATGDLFWIAGGSVYHHARGTGTTTLVASGFETLRGVVIARSSGLSSPPGDHSLYVAEGANPTRIHELAATGAPASPVALDQGEVVGRGRQVPVVLGFQTLDLATDQGGRLLVGGTTFGPGQFLKRITLTGTPSITTVASNADGLVGPVEGVCLAPDHSIYTLARGGTIQHLTTSPLVLTTVFTDPGNDILVGKDLALDLDGSFYVACRDDYDLGRVLRVALGTTSVLAPTEETRGLAPRPAGGLYLSQWRNAGFAGTVDLLHLADNSLEALPGFASLNYSNDEAQGDGDIVVDADGNAFTISEDDWSLVRYHADLDGVERIGSGYINPTGLAFALSTAGSGSTTGWSLYVSESTLLWEIPSSRPPAAPWVDASLGLALDRTLAGFAHPRFGRPSALVAAPSPLARLLVGTTEGWLFALEPSSGAMEPLCGPEQGLAGAIEALAVSPDARRTVLVTARAQAFELVGRQVRPLAAGPEALAAVLARARLAPQRCARQVDARTGTATWFALDGWAVWRVKAPE